MLRSSVFVSALVLATSLVGCGGDDIPGSNIPAEDSGFNDAITVRPDDGVDSAKADGGTDTSGTDTSGTDASGSDDGTDTLVAEAGDTATTTEGGTDTSTTDAAAFVEITVGGTALAYGPTTKTIKVGDTVRWTWLSAGHSVTSGKLTAGVPTPDLKYESGVLGTAATFTHKFDTAGTFDYYCSVHFSSGMVGKVVVTP